MNIPNTMFYSNQLKKILSYKFSFAEFSAIYSTARKQLKFLHFDRSVGKTNFFQWQSLGWRQTKKRTSKCIQRGTWFYHRKFSCGISPKADRTECVNPVWHWPLTIIRDLIRFCSHASFTCCYIHNLWIISTFNSHETYFRAIIATLAVENRRYIVNSVNLSAYSH